jgi:hypothetical protein
MFQLGIAAQLLAIASLLGHTIAISRRDATPYVPVPIGNVDGVPAEVGLRTSESWYWGPGGMCECDLLIEYLFRLTRSLPFRGCADCQFDWLLYWPISESHRFGSIFFPSSKRRMLVHS